ncbi:MAG: hypothetical protein WCI64_10400 [Chlorobium sp.]
MKKHISSLKTQTIFFSGGVMKSITVYGIDDILDKKINEKSKEFRLSQNQTVKKLLERSLSITESQNRRKEFSDLFGRWSIQDKEEFDKRIADLEVIHEADWNQ